MTTENPIQPQTKPEPQAPALCSGDLFGRIENALKAWDVLTETTHPNAVAEMKAAMKELRAASQPKEDGPHYVLVGYNGNGTPCAALAVYAASAGRMVVEANAVLMFRDAGHEHVKRAVAVSWPTALNRRGVATGSASDSLNSSCHLCGGSGELNVGLGHLGGPPCPICEKATALATALTCERYGVRADELNDAGNREVSILSARIAEVFSSPNADDEPQPRP